MNAAYVTICPAIFKYSRVNDLITYSKIVAYYAYCKRLADK